MTDRLTRADLLLAENIRALLAARHIDGSTLSMALGHTPSWLSKIMGGDRKMSVEDAGRVAAYFGLTIAELFSPGISLVTERRRRTRRGMQDRRALHDRREKSVAFGDSSVIQRDTPLALHTPGVVTHVARPSGPFELPRDWEAITLDDVDRRIVAVTDQLGKLYALRKTVTSATRPAPPVGKGGTGGHADSRTFGRASSYDRRRKTGG